MSQLTLVQLVLDPHSISFAPYKTNNTCGGYNYDSTLIRRPFDSRSTKVIKITVT